MTDRTGARSRGPWLDLFESSMDVDIAEYDDEIVVMADLPGFERADIRVSIADETLAIHAKREQDFEGESQQDPALASEAPTDKGARKHGGDDTRTEGAYLHRERRHESVSRHIDLPHPVSEDDATATYRNGVLTVTLPLAIDRLPEKSHQIDIE